MSTFMFVTPMMSKAVDASDPSHSSFLYRCIGEAFLLSKLLDIMYGGQSTHQLSDIVTGRARKFFDRWVSLLDP